MFEPGHRIGNYEVIRRLSAGGMATLYLGRRVGAAGFARPVALKVIHPHLAENAEFAAMFIDEAHLCARIDHPNVVHVEELGQIKKSNTLFLVMEFVDGRSLAQLVKGLAKLRRRMSQDLAVAIVAQVAAGLHAAHEIVGDDGEPLNVVHRDVTPHNVLLAYDGHVKVIDFGIAKSAQRHQTTRAGVLKGKVRFMSPEQAWGKPIDRRSDIFSLGILLWELLTLKRLFDGETDIAVIHQLKEPRIAAPSVAGAATTPELDAVVLKALSSDPDDRPATAHDFRRMLLEAVPRAASIDAAEIGALMKTVLPSARVSTKTGDPASSSWTKTFDSVVPPSFDVLATATAEDPRVDVDVDKLFGDTGSDPSHATDSRRTVTSTRQQVLVSGGQTERAITIPPRSPGRISAMALAAIGVAALAGAIGFTAFRGDPGPTAIASVRPSPTAPPAARTPPPPPTCGKNMARIPAGSFFMGSDDREDLDFEKPAHKVTLTRDFCMDVFEVTTEDYKAASDSGQVKRASQNNDWDGITAAEHKAFDPICNVRAPEDRGKHPINCVSWDSADAYCKAMKKRLPTEAEWEYAARGPDGRKYPWGDELPGPNFLNACGKECLAWGKKNHLDPTGLNAAMYADDDGFPTTAPVGSFPNGKSRYGVQDVVGNVWEWVADWYAPYAPDELTDPAGPPDGEQRVARGGAWNGAMASWVRPTFRFRYTPTMRSHGIGFRCASSL